MSVLLHYFTLTSIAWMAVEAFNMYVSFVQVAIVGFFIPVSSLKVFGHSIPSERSRIYLGDQYKLFRMTPLSYHDYSVSGSSILQCSGIPLKLLCLFSSLIVPHKNVFCQVTNQYRSLMTFRNKTRAKTFTWPDMLFYAR